MRYNEEGRLVCNKMITPDGTILESRNRHDFRTYVDKNGKTYMIDGGLDCVRGSAQGDEKYVSVYDTSPMKEVREHMTWGTYGKDGNQPLSYIKLKDMESDHIRAVLNLKNIYPQFRTCFERELKHRGEEIYMGDGPDVS